MAYARQDIETAFPGGKWSNGEYLIKSPIRPEERTASFRINPEKASYFDFGSGQGGKLSELFKLTGQDDPFHGEGGARPAPRSREAEEAVVKRQAALDIWEAAGDPAGHPYLLHKGVAAYGARRSNRGAIWKDGRLKELTGDFLVIPAYGPDGSMIGIEQITPSGKPKYDLGGKGVFLLGECNPSFPLLVAEGFSTAASLKKITGWNVACAFGTGNIRPAVDTLRRQFNGEVFVTPDTGTEDFTDVADVVEIPGERPKNTDWNDLVSALGVEQAKELFQEAWAKARKKKELEKVEDKVSLRSFRQTIEPTRGQKPEMIGGIFPRGGVSVMAGQQGTGKSLLMQKFCSDVSLGGEILDGVSGYAAKRKTVYFVGELPVNTMNDRQRTAEWRQNPDNLILYSRITMAKNQIPLDLDDGEGFRNVAEIIMDEKPDLVVFDSLMSFLSCDESDMKAMQGAFTKMVRLADDMQCAVVVVHHIRKRKALERASRLHMDDIIGSSIITRNASLAIGAEKLKTDDGEEMVYVSNLKSWYAPLDQFAFRISRDDYKIFRGIEIELNPKNPAVNKTEAIENAVFRGHADGSDFTVAGIAKVTGATDRYVRKLFREWEESGRIVSKGGSKNTSYSIMQKFRNDIQTLGMTEKDSGTSVPESSGILEGEHCANCIPEQAVPESFPVIATAEGAFRNYPMITGGEEKSEVYNPSDGEARPKGNLEPFFPGGLKTGLSSPRGGQSVSELAALGGVSEEAVREELDRWKKCNRLKVEDDGKIIILEGDRYPGQDEPEPPEEEDTPPAGPEKRKGHPQPGESIREKFLRNSATGAFVDMVTGEIVPDHIPDAGKKTSPGQAALQFNEGPTPPTTPPGRNPLLEIVAAETPSTPRGETVYSPEMARAWLDAQPEEVKTEYRAKVKRLKGVDMPDYETVALLRTWEEFRGRR